MIMTKIVNVTPDNVGKLQITIDGDSLSLANEMLGLMCWYYDTEPENCRRVLTNFKEHIKEKEGLK